MAFLGSSGRLKLCKKITQLIRECFKRIARCLKLSSGVRFDVSGYFKYLLQKSQGKSSGDKCEGGTPKQFSELRAAKTQKFSDNLESVKEQKDFTLKMYRVFNFIVEGDTNRSGEFLNLSVSEEFRSLLLDAMRSEDWDAVECLIMPIAEALYRKAAVNRAAVNRTIIIWAALLVAYLHLIALVDRGGGKVYSSGSLGFRSIYVSILLFLGAHVWIKSRDVAPPSLQKPTPGLHRKCKVSESGEKVYHGNFEPRFKPPGSENYISVGSYELEEDAKTMYRILAFYFDKDDGALTLKNGFPYHVQPMTQEEQRCFSGLDLVEKKKWVIKKAKAILEDYRQRGCSDWGCIDWGSSDLGSQQDCGSWLDGFNQPRYGFESAPSNCAPEVGPGTQWTQYHITNDTVSGRVGGDASLLTMPESSMRSMPETVTNIPVPVSATGADGRLRGEQPLEPQNQQESLQENQANNSSITAISDDLSFQRQLRELQGQMQLEQSRNQQLESLFQQQESRFQQQESRFQQQESRFRQQESRFQQQEARLQQLESRVSELQDEVERFRSTEHARKRSCTSLTLRHESQN